MCLLCVPTATAAALERLQVPFVDLTPEGFRDGSCHLLAMSVEQRDVLLGWGLPLEEMTPAMLERAMLREPAGAAAGGAPAASRTRSEDVVERRGPRPGSQHELERSIVLEALAEREERA